ncbi:MAG: hypothetical protein ACRDQU_05830 [Pseudonocardiaceae bacterium]
MVVIEVRNAELMETVTNEAKRLDITGRASPQPDGVFPGWLDRGRCP